MENRIIDFEEKVLEEMKNYRRYMPSGYYSHCELNPEFNVQYNAKRNVVEVIIDAENIFFVFQIKNKLEKENLQLRNEIERLRIDAVLEEDLNNIQFGNFKELLNEDKG